MTILPRIKIQLFSYSLLNLKCEKITTFRGKKRGYMNKTAAADVVIFGGGVAGLWLLHRLRQAGYSAILFESDTLGGGQTNKAQGIIHGGMKYALQGVLTGDANAVSDMPALWRDCLQGKGEINLSSVPILSQHHYLWSPGKFTSKFTGFLASAALSSKVEPLSKENYPSVFQHAAFKGEVFSLDELVIDVPLLVRELAKANQEAVFKIEPVGEDELQFDKQGQLVSATVYYGGKAIHVSAQQFVFTAGAGNEVIIKKFNPPVIAMQLRPLHMVLVKMPHDFPLYAHCLGFGARPRITITTHYMQDGSSVWYLGGLIAEEGVDRDSPTQVKAARAELEDLFPWIDFSKAEFATFFIDRAEPKQKTGLKPESSFFKSAGNVTIAWPTKLALAPKLAADIIAHLKGQRLTHQLGEINELRAWPMPLVASSVWEDIFCKSAK